VRPTTCGLEPVGCTGRILSLPCPNSTAHASPIGCRPVALPSTTFKRASATHVRPPLQSPVADNAAPLDNHRGVMPCPLDQGASKKWPQPTRMRPKPTPPRSPNLRRLHLQQSRAQLAAMAVPDCAHVPNYPRRPCPSTLDHTPT
jgi:hypothetical protein